MSVVLKSLPNSRDQNCVQTTLPFVDPYEARVLPFRGFPFWTLNTFRQGGGMAQKPFRLEQMDFVLRNCAKDTDTYISQALFSKPNRRALNVAFITHAYVDLDIYKLSTPPAVGQEGMMIRLFCRDEGIPEPSAIISSGRGIYLKWFYSSPVPRAGAGRAVAINRALVKRFEAWGSDPCAVDVSRVLRLVGSVNTKNGETVQLLHQQERDGKVLTYDFEMFGDEVLQFTTSQIKGFRDAKKARSAEIRLLSHERARRQASETARETRKGNQKAFCREEWHWGVLEDLRRLAEIRQGGAVPFCDDQAGGKVGPDIFGHIGACQLPFLVQPSQLWGEVHEWARIILPASYVNGPDFKNHCSTLLAKAKEESEGKKVEHNGKHVTPVYTYRAETIIERLEITGDEMRQMTRLIDKDEKRRRDREAWRADHTGMSREEYEGRAEIRRGQAREMKARGMTNLAISFELGVSEEWVRKSVLVK